ncbi:MAG: hypothetical protein KC910_03365 [Candidatus Eremiobacteraeota bacterium]|nr:hypothetical protein [Candidatus Eremiobacteraeota bacterium]
MVKGAAKTGQALHLTGLVMGLQTPGVAGALGLMGGTYDVLHGGSVAQQAAINRNLTGSILGSLQVLQGVATYASVLAPTFGAPAVVGQGAALVAAGAFAGRMGYEGFAAVKGAVSGKASATGGGSGQPGAMGTMQANGELGSMAAVQQSDVDGGGTDEVNGDSRVFENLFAANRSVSEFVQRIGGIGAFWNNFDAIRGGTPGGIWGILGIVGSTTSVMQGMAELTRGASNQHRGDTVGGALHVIQGLGSVGASLGMGRTAGFVAAGAWAARTAYMMYEQSKQLQGGDNEDSMTDVIVDSVKTSLGLAHKDEAKAA